MSFYMEHDAHKHSSFSFGRSFLIVLIFTMAYLTTITVQAQDVTSSGDAIQLTENNRAVITGTIVSAEDNVVIVNAAGKDMKVDLTDVKLKAPADDVFEAGMNVTVEGEMNGNDFGVPLVKARAITATAGPSSTYYQQRNPYAVP